MGQAKDDWYDPYGCQDVDTATDYIAELEQQVAELEAELEAARDGSTLLEVIEERDRLREALQDVIDEYVPDSSFVAECPISMAAKKALDDSDD